MPFFQRNQSSKAIWILIARRETAFENIGIIK